MTPVYSSSTKLNTLVPIIYTELIKISAWFKLNKQSLNASKTNIIYVQSSNYYCNEKFTLNIIIDNIKNTRVTNAKFLCVIINSRLIILVYVLLQRKILVLNVGYVLWCLFPDKQKILMKVPIIVYQCCFIQRKWFFIWKFPVNLRCSFWWYEYVDEYREYNWSHDWIQLRW